MEWNLSRIGESIFSDIFEMKDIPPELDRCAYKAL